MTPSRCVGFPKVTLCQYDYFGNVLNAKLGRTSGFFLQQILAKQGFLCYYVRNEELIRLL